MHPQDDARLHPAQTGQGRQHSRLRPRRAGRPPWRHRLPLVVTAALCLAWPAVGARAADPLYPSTDCTSAAGVLIDGFVGPAHVVVRTDSGPPASVCIAIDTGTAHVGGKVVIDSALPGIPFSDNNQAACAADPNNTRVRSGTIGPDNEPYRIDVTNRTDAVWVCVQATSVVAKRVVIAKSGSGTSGFLPDATAPYGYTERAAPVGQASAACQTAASGTKTRLVNADVGTAHLWAYIWQEPGGAKSHLCLRAQQPAQSPTTAVGGRLDLDSGGSQSFVTTDTSADFSPCDFNLASDPTATVPYVFKIRNPLSGSPAWACLRVDSTYRRVKLDAGGSQGVAGFTPDT